MKRNWAVMNHLTLTLCLLILWGLAYIFSYNKKPKKRGWWACLHECEFRLLFPWEIFPRPPPVLLSVIDGATGWRGFLLAKHILKSPSMWEESRFPEPMMAVPHELLTGHDELRGLGFPPEQSRSCGWPDFWTMQGRMEGCGDAAIGMDRALDHIQWKDWSKLSPV